MTYEGSLAFEIYYDHNMVFAGWSKTPGANVADYHPGSIVESGVSDLYAVWIEPTSWSKADYDDRSEVFNVKSRDQDYTLTERLLQFEAEYGSNHTVIYDSASEYGTIYTLSGDNTISNLSMGTYRSTVSSTDPSTASIDFSGNVVISGNVILDNLSVIGSSGRNHGDVSGGLYANGKRLIFGTGIIAPSMTDETRYLQVFGGNTGQDLYTSTSVAIFSGVYYNVVAGSQNAKIEGNTNLVMRGGIVLDTVIGGNGGRYSGEYNYVSGSTHVYMLGDVWMPGDYYEESAMGNASRFSNIPKITESTILTGGSNNGKVGGDTNVYVSNSAELWDVQAGGRRGSSEVIGVASAEVSGSGMVKHVLCGSITDGIDSGSARQSVKHTSLEVTGNARVGSVFGAGYDTYYSASQPSMYGEDSSISISIEGGIVGSVYGGGYRGTIGTPDEPIGSIDIRISGGAVLLDVFGGGRGGLDKVIHDDDDHDNEDPMHEASMKDTTGFSNVYANSISVQITGGGIGGSVYGGGESVPVIDSYNGLSLGGGQSGVASVVSTSVSVSLAGGKVQGSVYGAGKGVDISDVDSDGYHRTASIFAMDRDGIDRIPWIGGSGGTSLQDTDYGEFASLTGNVSVSIRGASIDGDVYGGGQYGRTGPLDAVSNNTMTIDIGGGTNIDGDVFSGGLGRTDELSVNMGNRTVTIDHAFIGGSVYGGSSFGSDNCVGGKSLGDYSSGESYIYLRSGDIASGTSGNVYGGSYRGHSYMNSHVYVGSPALDGNSPKSKILTVKSVYGGASVGESSGISNSEELLIGTTDVRIGSLMVGSNVPYYTELSITGDVFGEGDYCSISGEASVRFDGFRQNGSFQSIQKADSLTVVGSSLKLWGSVDGSTTQESNKKTLSRIGNLVLQKSDAWGASYLDLHAEVSDIGGYSSLESDGTVGIVPDFTTDVSLNSVTLYDGMMMYITGIGVGNVTNPIQGYTIISNGESSHHGSFATGVTSQVINGSTGFFVYFEGEYRAAQEAHYTIGDVGITSWYIPGVYRAETTIVLSDDGSTSIAGDADIKVPRTVADSTISFAGGYVTSNTPGSLSLVGSQTDLSQGGRDFLMMVGDDPSSGSNPDYMTIGTDGVAAMPDDPMAFDSGSLINIRVSTVTGFSSTGYVGTVTLHTVEMIGSIPINTFDINVGIYLRTQQHTDLINMLPVIKSEDGSFSGTTDIYLPILSNNAIAKYYISMGSEANGAWTPWTIPQGCSISIQAVPSNLNKNGWLDTSYDDGPVGFTETGKPGLMLGSGGVFSPVLRLSYTFQDMEQVKEIPLTVWLYDELTGEVEAIHSITLIPEEVKKVTLSFHDRSLIYASDGIGWTDHSLIFTLNIDFGLTPGSVYVAYDDNRLIEWFRTDGTQGLDSYGVFLMESDSVAVATTSNKLEGNEGYTVASLESFLQHYVEVKPDTYYREPGMEATDSDLVFDYSVHPNWFDTRSCLTEFDFGQSVTDDVSIYAGYSISLTVIPFLDFLDPDSPSKDYSVTPSMRVLGIPGQEVDLERIYQSLTVTPGYVKVQTAPWWAKDSEGNLVEIAQTVITPFTNSTVYLHMERASYTVVLVVDGQEKTDYTFQVGDVVSQDHTAHFGDQIKVSFDSDTKLHIGTIYGTTPGGQFNGFNVVSSEGNNEINFSMPNGNLTINITMTDLRTVTVNIPDDGVCDNGRFGVELVASGGLVTVNIVQNSGTKTAKVQVSPETMRFETETTLGLGSVLITAYESGSDTKLCLMKESPVLDLRAYTGDVTISVYVSVKWELSISGTGYVVDKHPISDPKNSNVFANTVSYDSTSKENGTTPFVVNGDRLVARSVSTGGNNLVDLVVTNLAKDASAPVLMTYIFESAGNPSMSNPVFKDLLNVILRFSVDGSPLHIEASGWQPSGRMTVSGKGLDETVQLTLSDGVYRASLAVVSGEYTVVAEYEGFGTVTKMVTLSDMDQILEFDLVAIQYTVNVKVPDREALDKVWYVNDLSTIVQFSGYSGDAEWFIYTDPAAVVNVSGNSCISVSMFDQGRLYIVGVPGLSVDQGETVKETRIIVVEGEINGTHDVQLIQGLSERAFQTTILEQDVNITYVPEGSDARITISGCPEGLGGLVFFNDNLRVVVIALPHLEAQI